MENCVYKGVKKRLLSYQGYNPDLNNCGKPVFSHSEVILTRKAKFEIYPHLF